MIWIKTAILSFFVSALTLATFAAGMWFGLRSDVGAATAPLGSDDMAAVIAAVKQMPEFGQEHYGEAVFMPATQAIGPRAELKERPAIAFYFDPADRLGRATVFDVGWGKRRVYIVFDGVLRIAEIDADGALLDWSQ